MAVTPQLPFSDRTILDTINNSHNSRKTCNAPFGSAITDIVVSFPGWDAQPAEQDLPGPYQVQAAIEYPLGTFTQCFHNGQPTLTVVPGRSLFSFDPVAVHIPAGAIFYVKTYATWNPATGMSYGRSGASVAHYATGQQEWTTRGIDVPNLLMSPVALNTSATAAGMCCLVRGRVINPTAVVAVYGESQEMAYGADCSDATYGWVFIARAMHGSVPVLNLSRAGDTLGNWLSRRDGRAEMVRDSVTHLIVALASNDTFARGILAENTWRGMQAAAAPLMERGVKAWVATVCPRTRSTDLWATHENQVPVDAGLEAQRQAFNTLARSAWRSAGFAGCLDFGRAIDPDDTGLWNTDGVTGWGAGGFAVLDQGRIRTVYPGANAAPGNMGYRYPASASVPCVVHPMPGDTTGGGGVIVAHTNVRGAVASFSVEDSGHGYQYPPLISVRGAWTNGDGIHQSSRGYDEIIVQTKLSPAMFVL